MDTRLRTSFVPKKTLVAKTGGGGGNMINPLMSLAVIIFFMSCAFAGGAYLYKALLNKQIDSQKIELAKAKEAFDLPTIQEWKRRDNRIKVANELLTAHRIISPAFSILEKATLQTTRFLNFDFKEDAGNLSIKMEGEGINYTSVALLSDSFNEQAGIKNPIFSNLSLSSNGGVKFSFTGALAPSVVSFKETFSKPESE
jgi:hypothetical protein